MFYKNNITKHVFLHLRLERDVVILLISGFFLDKETAFLWVLHPIDDVWTCYNKLECIISRQRENTLTNFKNPFFYKVPLVYFLLQYTHMYKLSAYIFKRKLMYQ